MSNYIYNRIMINYNIMNIILDKKAFEEWQDKVIKVHKEFDKKYGIIVIYNRRFLEIDINEIYNGNFFNLFIKDKVKCINCKEYYYVYFNHRNIEKYIFSKYIYIRNKSMCFFCTSSKSRAIIP